MRVRTLTRVTRGSHTVEAGEVVDLDLAEVEHLEPRGCVERLQEAVRYSRTQAVAPTESEASLEPEAATAAPQPSHTVQSEQAPASPSSSAEKPHKPPKKQRRRNKNR